ncbi:MAG: hypothetical protein HC899_14505 [Leptolyngbyaceae cyanobacterium SM1_4_3]|nr:hypothetical protein [Leptolyngbyaceae cyanobacterium SM1_4_3]NJN90871.1 hypothetical protein [Leptolyngbyaceae cyanobacterium SL_5_14]
MTKSENPTDSGSTPGGGGKPGSFEALTLQTVMRRSLCFSSSQLGDSHQSSRKFSESNKFCRLLTPNWAMFY